MLTEILTGGVRWPTARFRPSWRAWPSGLRLWGSWRRGLPVSRSAVSQHLKILKDAGLVEDTAAGTRRIYRVNPVALAALRDQLDAGGLPKEGAGVGTAPRGTG